MTECDHAKRVELPLSEKYKSACESYIRRASKRPGMYFRSLVELENQMHGHAVAYDEFGEISGYDDFNIRFRNWLYENFQLSCCSGWAYAFVDSTESEDEAAARFFELAEQFLEQW